MIRIILVRHGQTEWNKFERFRGRVDVDLDETGRRQAEAVAERITQWKVNAIYSSPLKRAMNTAQTVASRLGLTVHSLEGINDMDFGEWQGLPIDEARGKYGALFDLWLYHPEKLEIPGAETLDDVRKRVVATIDDVMAKHEDQTIALVSHRVVCKVLLCHLLGLDNSHFWQIAQDTTAINLFEIWDGRPSVMLINDICHLRDMGMTVDQIISLLKQEYGALERQSHGDPLSELIATILSQNTSDVNSKRAFDQLVATFGSWEQVAEASTDQIAEAIKGGGLNRIKAGRIRTILEHIRKDQGSLDLEFLRALPSSEAKVWLEELPGVGPKTAACVLLFSLGRPALPVDTHIYRVSRRLGLIASRASAKEAHQLLEEMVPPQARYQFHLHMLAHGRSICKAPRPLCHKCILEEGCPKII